MKEAELRINATYKGKGTNTFTLFREYHQNETCFLRQDGSLHYGREFIEFRDGDQIIDLSES